ncbi:hypothetical protein B0H11DRAFT_1934540 [Mycena galericulata]|nr:hypothetical protein B0H11DRAFT_1934540 [Mycena galericulata]
MLFSNGGKVSGCGERDVMCVHPTHAHGLWKRACTCPPRTSFPNHYTSAPPTPSRIRPHEPHTAKVWSNPLERGALDVLICDARSAAPFADSAPSDATSHWPVLHALRPSVTPSLQARTPVPALPQSSEGSELPKLERHLHAHMSLCRPAPSQHSPGAHATISQGVRRKVGLALPTDIGCTRLVQAEAITASNAELRCTEASAGGGVEVSRCDGFRRLQI